ncbi:helix-turn-helix transcriptional regulator [Streptomyces sp. NPDC002519]
MGQARASWYYGDLTEGISCAETAAQTACDHCSEPCAPYARLQQALFFASIRRLDPARRILEDVTAAAGARDDAKLTAATTLVDAKIALAGGDLVDAAGRAEAGLRLANAAGLTGWTPLGNLVLATTALRRGELTSALHFTNQLKEDAVFGREMLPASHSAWIVIQLTEAEKGRKKAAALAHELLESESAFRSLLTDEPAAIPWLVRILVAEGLHDLAQHGVALADRLAAENPGAHSLGVAASHGAALLQQNLDRLRRAAEDHVDPWARAVAFEDVGALLSEGGERSPEAVESLELATRAYAEMGSLRDLSRVRSLLRGLNGNSQAQVRFWPRSRIPGLTDTEYAVAKLVSSGITNGQAAEQMFLSRHTVAFHLRKVFQKTGVKSRLELAVMWHALDADPEETRPQVAGGRRARDA